MCDNWRGCAENWGKESLASNQVVGDSNPSGCAKFIKHLRCLRKGSLSEINSIVRNNSELQGGNRWLGATVGSVLHQYMHLHTTVARGCDHLTRPA